MSFYFYLAQCSDNSLYAGYCKNLADREKKHNNGKGAKYTLSRKPVKIIYHEKFATRSEAMKREAEVKKFTRKQKKELLQAQS
jgi:putative endonuclease